MGYAENLRDYVIERTPDSNLISLSDPDGTGTVVITAQILRASNAAIEYFETYGGITYASGADHLEIAADIVILKLEEWGGISDSPNHIGREMDVKARLRNLRAKINVKAPRTDKSTWRAGFSGRFDNGFEDFVRKNPGDSSEYGSYERRGF